MSFRNSQLVALRDFFEQLGPSKKAILDSFKELLENKDGKGIRPEQISLKELWQACREYEGGRASDTFWRDAQESVSSDMFPTLTGEIISSAIIGAYQNPALIGDRLVAVTPSRMKVDRFAGFTASQSPEETPEGMPYNDSSIGEKYFETTNVKFGRVISVTEEAVALEKSGEILERARGIGSKAALYKERLILRAIMDLDGQTYKPSGIAEALYTASPAHGNLLAANPFGEAGVAACLQALHNMKDEEGDPIMIAPSDLLGLFPYDLYDTASQLVSSTLVPETSNNAVNRYKGLFEPLTSPYITEQSATTYFLGAFKQMYKWSEIWPLQVFALQSTNDSYMFKRDILAMYKARFFGSCLATDYRMVIKSTI